jgi:cytochrome P450
MTTMDVPSLDRDRIRKLFDLRSNKAAFSGGEYTGDPYPAWHDLRSQAEIHPGTVHELTGYHGKPMFHGLPFEDRPHFSAFSYAACDDAYRNPGVFASSPNAGPSGELDYENSMLMMGGTQHRRYRSLVQPSFVPAKAQWWIRTGSRRPSTP